MIYVIRGYLPIFFQNWIKTIIIRRKHIEGDKKSLMKITLTSLLNDEIHLGKNSKINGSQIIGGGTLSLGDFSYIEENCNFSSYGSTIRIGKFCSIAAGVQFITGTDHDYTALTTYPSPYMESNFNSTKDIIIGNDVWIGRNAIIVKGVTIGTGAVIGAGSIVTKDIPPYAIACGNPARIIKYRFPDNTIKELLESERWERDLSKIKQNYHLEFLKNREKLG